MLIPFSLELVSLWNADSVITADVVLIDCN
jgi:hypothetical protein